MKTTKILLTLLLGMPLLNFAQGPGGSGGPGGGGGVPPCTPLEGYDLFDNVRFCTEDKNLFLGVEFPNILPYGVHKLNVRGNSAFDGNIGVGTAASNLFKVDIAGNLNLLSGSAQNHALFVKGNEALWHGTNPSNSQTYFSWGFGADYNFFKRGITVGYQSFPALTPPTSGMLIEGNVGIHMNPANTAPQAYLHIDDNNSAAGTPFLRIGNDAFLSDVDIANTMGVYGVQNASNGRIKLGETGAELWGYPNTSGLRELKLSGNSRWITARDDFGGQVYIGDDKITSGIHQDFKLAVDGKIVAKEIVVTTLSWADYVFEEEYPLMPLEEVQDFIAKNSHLPNVPSAEEMESNGLNISETNTILMEKIEELTLYLIAQNERLNLIEKENAELRELVNKK
jgi:hypothetical protein